MKKKYVQLVVSIKAIVRKKKNKAVNLEKQRKKETNEKI